jgi:methyl-accepting chemotaxis protein
MLVGSTSLARRFAVTVTAILVVLLVISATVSYRMQRAALEELLGASNQAMDRTVTRQTALDEKAGQIKAAQVSKMMAAIAPSAIASLQLSDLLNYATVATGDPDISYAAFQTGDGRDLASAGRKEAASDGGVVEQNVVSDGLVLGKVIVGYNHKRARALIEETRAENRLRTNEMAAAMQSSLNLSLIGQLVMYALVIVAAALAILAASKRMVGPLSFATGIAQRIAVGELGHRIETGRRDEIGHLLEALGTMNGRLTDTVGDVRNASHSILAASAQISAGNASLSQRTEEQASSLEETASSMEEMTTTVKQNADSAVRANQMAEATRVQAEKGGEVVGQAVAAMNDINDASRKISDIIATIDGIAFQTNLLALNAAVEAARAGEQGRGFAVVAAEVRSLAQRSANAAKEIKALIGDSVAKVGVGSKLVEQSGATLSEIVISVKKVSDLVADIASASQEQSSGIEQVNRAIVQMDEMTQQNAALVEEAAAAARSLEDQARLLAQLMGFFKVGEERQLGFSGGSTAQITHASGAAAGSQPRLSRAGDPARIAPPADRASSAHKPNGETAEGDRRAADAERKSSGRVFAGRPD